MLTADLIRARSRKGALRCAYLDPDDPELLGDAAFLCDLFADGVARGRTQGELEAELDAEAQVRPDHKLLRGLAKVLLDTSDFEQDAPLEPVELRERVFRRAAERGPLALIPDPLGRPTAADVLRELADELGVLPEAIARSLYADRKAERRLVRARITDARALVERYNVVLTQSVLLSATRLVVTLSAPPAARVRQLLRVAKFHQLMHRARRVGEDLELTVDGPGSILSQSKRYGLKLATFFPHLLHLERWSLVADLAWKGGPRTLTLTPRDKLVPHVRDVGGHAPREAAWFQERFEALGSAWALREGIEPVDLGGEAVVMPDFHFEQDGRVAHLEIIGFWRKDYLQRRLDALRAHGPGNLILAVSKRLVGDGSPLQGFGGEVIPFAEVIPSRKVLDAVERVACAPR